MHALAQSKDVRSPCQAGELSPKLSCAIRDDDVSYFTPPEALEEHYGKLFKRGIPISFAVVPFQVPAGKGWAHAGDTREEFPLSHNKALIRWLQDKINAGLATIMLHGCTHRDGPSGPEFSSGCGHNLLIEKGRRHLEEIFSRPVRIFVPPHNALSRSGMNAVKEAGLHLLGGFSFSPRLRGWDMSFLPAYFCRKVFQFRHNTFYYPFPVHARGAKELACCSLTPDAPQDEVERLLSIAVNTGGRFCLATHAWELKNGQRLYTTVEMALASGGQPVLAEQLFEDHEVL